MKIRVVWLCHFANNEFKAYFKNNNINNFSPWIVALIELFKHNKEIELHIISPNVYTNENVQLFRDGIYFHFFKTIPVSNKYLSKIYAILRINYITNFIWIKKSILRNVLKINPHIVHLHGAENPHYSIGVLPLINEFPIIVTIQGFIRHTTENSLISKKRIKIEERILQKVTHFGTRTKDMEQTILNINPKARFYNHNYPIFHPLRVKDNFGEMEKYDCIFFGRICKDKGIEDLFVAIAEIKNIYPYFKALVIGDIENKYRKLLIERITALKIQNNIIWKGFLTNQDEIYEYAYYSKICVLPTYHDIIPGTIIESMLMKLPVITYNVGGIPEINENEERIILVEKWDKKLLAIKIIELINDIEKRVLLAEKAYIYAKRRFDNNTIVPEIIKIYKLIH